MKISPLEDEQTPQFVAEVDSDDDGWVRQNFFVPKADAKLDENGRVTGNRDDPTEYSMEDARAIWIQMDEHIRPVTMQKVGVK